MQERGTPAKQRLYKNRFEKSRRFFISPILNIDNSPENDIIRTKKLETAVKNVNYVGKINREIYKCITEDITTDEVVITDERVEHIKINHPGHYEKISPHLKAAVENPDYILKDTENTGLILKRAEIDNIRVQIVLRLHTTSDNTGYKNSIISAWEISESRWANYINNKIILYKSK